MSNPILRHSYSTVNYDKNYFRHTAKSFAGLPLNPVRDVEVTIIRDPPSEYPNLKRVFKLDVAIPETNMSKEMSH